ncbi:MAG: DUF6176 family protein [Sporolactobacillus sp.]|uniref:DUF6176 family protein n=1 Tax=Sporolactobacillus TaxID=2077 RepID=UPI002102E15D|nr:DUF6176 family protein [Sporolactobacillus sp. STSJ-5]MCQ2009724.1 DUF6176 family protein [Sporolactobacillus sp. STSJ-5]
MKTELSKFRVKKGKTNQVDEWLDFLNKRMPEVLLTLKNEKMYVEAIFRERDAENEYLYWFSIQGEGGIDVEDSNKEIDKIHLHYWYECIDESFHAPTLLPKVEMISERIKKIMND